ncbi:MAG: glycosyltransferase family 39 protein [Thermodesulfobacteriota bacterium]
MPRATPAIAAIALLGGAFVALLTWSWGRWPDVLVDFGRELYVPWQLASGRVLYRDVAYFNGPLSPYFNALWFALLGPSLRVLALVNGALVLLFVVLLYRLLERIGSRPSALIGCATFLLLFAFGQQLPIGNYNYLAPYSHEITHGTLLGLAALLLLDRFARTERTRDLVACAVCVGLALLTKPEVALAVVVAVSAGVLLVLAAHRSAARRRPRSLAVYVGAVALPPFLAAGLLALALPLGDAVAGVLGGHRWLLTDEITSLRFYRSTMGTLVPSASLRTVATWTAAWLLFLAVAAALDAVWRPQRIASHVRGAIAFFATLAVLLLVRGDVRWMQALLPLPVVALLAAVGFTLAALRARDDTRRARLVLAAATALLSLLLLAKIVLRVRAAHYGFVLAMPATMLAIVLIWDWLVPLVRRGGDGAVVRGALLAALAVIVAVHFERTASFYAAKTHLVGRGGDVLRADGRGIEVARLLSEIERGTPPGATLAVVPEGAMVNYLTRRPSSTPHVSFMPVEMAMFGEDEMLASLERRPPDFVLLVARPMHEFGLAGFGVDYGRRIAGWIGAHYRPVSPSPDDAPLVLMRRAAQRRR